MFPGPAAQRALSRVQAGNVPVLLVDEVAGGVWHQRGELDAQVARVGQVMEGEPVLTIGTVEAGRHL